MSQPPTSEENVNRLSRVVVAVGWLVGVYLVLTWVTAVAAVVLAQRGSGGIDTEASVHAVVLAVVSVLMLVFAVNLLRGRSRADLRLRIVAAILVVALVVTAVVLPLPAWMVAGHIVGALLLVLVVAALWPRRSTGTQSHK